MDFWMKVMKTYNKILYELATNNALPKCAIYAVSGNQQSVKRKLNEAIKCGHVREVKCKCKRKGKQALQVSIFMITKQGLYHLCQNCYRDIPWLENAANLEHVDKIINNQKMSREDIVKRYYRVSMVGAMADVAGAEELIIHLYPHEIMTSTINRLTSLIRRHKKMMIKVRCLLMMMNISILPLFHRSYKMLLLLMSINRKVFPTTMSFVRATVE